jgi:hypothetical protein
MYTIYLYIYVCMYNTTLLLIYLEHGLTSLFEMWALISFMQMTKHYKNVNTCFDADIKLQYGLLGILWLPSKTMCVCVWIVYRTCVLVFTVLCIVCTVFFIVSFMYIYAYLFCLYQCKDYCPRVTTQVQLVVVVVVVVVVKVKQSRYRPGVAQRFPGS